MEGIAYPLTLALCAAALMLAAACALLLWRRRQKNAPAAAVSGAESVGESTETGGGEPPRRRGRALPRLLAGSLVVAVACGLCLLTGAVQSPGDGQLRFVEEGGHYQVDLRPLLLSQSDLGPQVDEARREIRAAYEDQPAASGVLPGVWTREFDSWQDLCAFLGVELPWSGALDGGEAKPVLQLHGLADGSLQSAAAQYRCTVDGHSVLFAAHLFFSAEPGLAASLDPEGAQRLDWDYETTWGGRAVVQIGSPRGEGRVGASAWFARDGAVCLISLTGQAGEEQALYQALTELVDRTA